ncbi:DNA replication complex subunit Gins51 [Thermococcus stetteri]|uniref:DNA replication complex subunit Gins51 n=1 Tax=Thermococcus stetteri TaxID=49900 RepID=UPI001AEA8DFB|nr:DNA replication factor GINS [Thermococcus stetteri]
MDIVKLRELLEAELSSTDLNELDEDFYVEFDSLIKALKLSVESSRERGENVEERLYLAQLKIAESLMKEIIKLRLHKIVDLAVEGKIAEMTTEEKRLFNVIRAFVEREEIPEILEEVSQQEETEVKIEHKPKNVPKEAYIIQIDLPAILGPDMKEYGPFMAGDMAIIPTAIGRALVEREAARRVKISL